MMSAKLNTYLLGCLVIVFLGSCKMQSQETVIEESAPRVISAEKLEALDQYLDQNIENAVIPGGVFYIANKDKVLYHKAKGIKDPSSNAPYKIGDIFRIASMTKAYTSLAIMQLYERGKLDLDDPISKYLPEFSDMTVIESFNEDGTYEAVPAESQITIRNCLTHTSGISYGFNLTDHWKKVYEDFGIINYGTYDPETTTLEMARKIAKTPLMHHPGEQWTYGLSMDVLGAVIEKITKKKLSLFFLTEIFYPSGMTDSHFYLPEAKYNKLVPLYTVDESGNNILYPEPTFDYNRFLNKGHYAGGGGACGSAKDYGKFLGMLLNGGAYKENQIIESATLDLMLTNQFNGKNNLTEGLYQVPGMTYCLGSQLVTDSKKEPGPFSKGTYSWGGAFNSKWWVDPKEELIFVGMTNILPFENDPFWNEMYDIVYGALE